MSLSPDLPPSAIDATAETAVVAAQARPIRRSGLRAVVLALLLAPLTAYWTFDQFIDIVCSLMIPPVMVTLAVALLNLCIRRVAPKLALTEGELVLTHNHQATYSVSINSRFGWNQ